MPDSYRVPSEHGLELLRVLQEALTNVLKHSRATRVDIALHSDPDALRLSVSDDGIGLDPDALVQHPGTGMRSMRQRAQRLGGTLNLDAAPGRTVITMQLPMREPTRPTSPQ